MTYVLRLLCCILALPAFTAQAQTTLRVPQDHATIQAAIDAAVNGDTVRVAPGRYVENLQLKAGVTLESENGPAVTIIDGNRAGPVVKVMHPGGVPSVLRGFTITRGLFGEGAGILVLGGGSALASIITGNIIVDNLSCVFGGIALQNASAIIQGNVISRNNRCADGGGGAILVGTGSQAQILGNVVADSDNGGGIRIAVGTSGLAPPLIKGNFILGNSIGEYGAGGGIAIDDFDPVLIVQNVIAGNTAGSGGAIKMPIGSHGSQIINNTIVDNDSLNGSALALIGNSYYGGLRFANNLIIGKPGQTAVMCVNTADMPSPPQYLSNNIFSASGTAFGGTCSDVAGSSGNISVDPQFVGRASYDFRLQAESPAIDVGDGTVSGLPSGDFLGSARIADGDGNATLVIDQGAYEYGLPPAVLGVTPGLTSFGTFSGGDAPIARTITLSNTGLSPISVSAMAIIGPDAKAFALATGGASPCSGLTVTLAAGASCTVVVTLGTPSSSGSKRAALAVMRSAPDYPTVVALEGMVGTIDIVPDAFAFAPQSGVSLSSVRISNTVSVTGMNVPAPISVAGGQYSIDGDAFTEVPGLVTGGQTVRLRLQSHFLHGSPTTATLTVGGVSRDFTVTTLGPPIPTPSQSQFNFGIVAVGSTSGVRTVNIQNTGDAVLQVNSISIVNSGSFSVISENCAGQALVTGTGCSVQFAFSPGAAGLLTGALRISHRSGNHLDVPVMGFGSTGTNSGIHSALNFAPLPIGASWIYHKSDGSSSTRTVLASIISINGVEAKRVTFSDDGSESFFTNDAAGYRYFGDSIPPFLVSGIGYVSGSILLNPPMLEVGAQFSIGQTFSSSGTAALTYSLPAFYSLSYNASSTVVAEEMVTVPAGTFSAIRFDETIRIFGAVESTPFDLITQRSVWRAEGVGEVKSVSTESDGETTVTNTSELTATSMLTSAVGSYSFQHANNVSPGSTVASNSVVVDGINVAVPVSILNGEYSINGGAWTSAGGTIFPGQSVAVRHTASATFGVTTSATLTVGGVSASFNVTTGPPSFLLTVSVTGSGAVTSAPSGISCGVACTASYVQDTSVTLAAVPGSNYTFTGWNGDCSGTGVCTVTVNAARNVAAVFTELPDTAVPTVPQGLSAAAIGPSQIRLAWQASSDNKGVTQYRVFRNGVLLTTLGSITTYADTGLAASTPYSYAVAACDAAANCSAQSATASAGTLPPGHYVFSAQLETGWNLIGNSFNTGVDPVVLFGNLDTPVAGITQDIASVWKWDALTQGWMFYSPQLTSAAIAGYAAAHGMSVISTINPGEGYWVNAINAVTLPSQSGAVSNWSGLSFQGLPSSWNLITQGEPASPAQFNIAVTDTLPSPGQVPTGNFVSLWAWDALQGRWYFYAPVLEASGGPGAVRNYAEASNYLHFQDLGKLLEPGTGFWVNRP